MALVLVPCMHKTGPLGPDTRTGDIPDNQADAEWATAEISAVEIETRAVCRRPWTVARSLICGDAVDVRTESSVI